MTYSEMMKPPAPRRPAKKYLWLFVLAGAIFSFIFGNQIGAFEDRVIEWVAHFFKK